MKSRLELLKNKDKWKESYKKDCTRKMDLYMKKNSILREITSIDSIPIKVMLVEIKDAGIKVDPLKDDVLIPAIKLTSVYKSIVNKLVKAECKHKLVYYNGAPSYERPAIYMHIS